MGTTFTFERAFAKQCKKGQMPVTWGSAEYTYFVPRVAKILEFVGNTFGGGGTNQILSAWVEESGTWEAQLEECEGPNVQYVRFTQLAPTKDRTDSDNTSGTYESLAGDKVLGPDNVVYDLKPPPYSKCSFEVVIQSSTSLYANEHGHSVPVPEAAVKVSVGKYKADGKTLGASERNSTVTYVQFGEILAGDFVGYESEFHAVRFCMKLDPAFTIEAWPAPAKRVEKRPLTPPPSEEGDEPPTVDMPFDQGEPMFDEVAPGCPRFVVIDGCLSMLGKKEKDPPIKLANFTVDKLVRVMQAEEDDSEPIYVVQITWTSKQLGDEEIFIGLNDPVPIVTPRAKSVTAEVAIVQGKMSTMPQMRTLFNTRGSCFFLMPKFSPNVLSFLLHAFQALGGFETTKLVTTFGHVREGLYLMGNVAFQDATLLELGELGYTVSLASFVGDKRRKLGLSHNDVPKLKVVPQPWVRFRFFFDLYRTTFAEQFLNNELPAKATLATAVMHLQYHNLMQGVLGQPMCPGALLVGEKGTGKTAAMSCAQAFIGKKDVSAKLGVELSLPVLSASLQLQAGLTYVIDEVATHQSLKNEQGTRLYKNLVHMCYDGTTRGVMQTENSVGCTEPRTSFIATANVVPLFYDPPSVERVLHIHFKPLEGGHTDGAKTVEQSAVWKATMEMMSCVMPDFAALVYNGHLDKSAIIDCCSYMNAVCGVSYQRLCNMWGFLLYYMLLLEFIAMGNKDSVTRIFEWATFECYKQYKLVAKNSTVLLKFLKAVKLLYNQQQKSNDMEKTLHHHNVRMQPGDDTYIALRVTLCVSAIQQSPACQRMHYTLDVNQLHDAVEHAPLECKWGPARFYDTTKNPWPIQTLQFDPVTNLSATLPLLEADLQEASLQLYFEDVLWIKKTLYESCDVHTVVAPDFKTTVITSARKGYYEDDAYNLYESAFPDESAPLIWHGYLVVRSTPFGNFCLDNYCFAERGQEKQQYVEEENAIEWHGVDDLYKPHVLTQHFHTDKPPECLPPALELNPFTFRNDPNDDMPMPDDPATCNFLRSKHHNDDRRQPFESMDCNEYDDRSREESVAGTPEKQAPAPGEENISPAAWDYEPDDEVGPGF